MRILIYIFLLFQSTVVCAQEVIDSIIPIKRSRFFTDIVKREGGVTCMQADYSDAYLKYKSLFLKGLPVEYLTAGNQLVLHFGRSGKLYRMEDRGDSLLYFVRMDKTVNYNYNINSYLFYSQGEIYELGGYGFWKSNGLLRQYNKVDQEWDIAPTNKEVHIGPVSSVRYGAWIDSSREFVYVPFQVIVNDGQQSLDNGLRTIFQAQRLNVKTRYWEDLGVVTDVAYRLLKDANWGSYASDKGLLLGFVKGLYFLDFINNRILFYNDPSLVQTLLRLQSYSHSYYHKGWVYNLNPLSYKYDSVSLDPAIFKPIGETIWYTPFPYGEVIGSVLFLLTIGVLLVYRSRKAKRLASLPVADPLLNAHPFTETEQALLQLLLGRSEKGLTANISDINYVLGVKDKTPGMQKKVRSDVMNNINEKYAFLSRQKEPVVQSIRSESDKRYFEYLINPACRETLRGLLP